MVVKIKPIDEIKRRYTNGASGASAYWLAEFGKSDVVGALKAPSTKTAYSNGLVQAPAAYNAAVDKLTDSDVKGPAMKKGEAAYRAGTAAAADKYAAGVTAVTGAVAGTIDLGPKGAKMSPENLNRFNTWIAALHAKSLERKGIR